MAITQETTLGQIEISASGRIQFREETQIYIDGTPFGTPQYHRSSIDPGFLNESGEIVPTALPAPPVTKGVLTEETDVNLNALLAAVRTPAVLAKWKVKLETEALAEAAKKEEEEKQRKRIEALLHAEEEKQKQAEALREREFAHRVSEYIRQEKEAGRPI